MKTVVLGITGSIAASKAADLLRRLPKAGHQVMVVMTPSATQFVGPLTFQTLSRNPVILEAVPTSSSWVPEHVKLAQDADLLLVAPATANILAKMAHGIADCALSTACLAHSGPVAVAPAMNTRMWDHPATQANLAILKKRGVTVIDPPEGELACGEEGTGRLAEVEDILSRIEHFLNS